MSRDMSSSARLFFDPDNARGPTEGPDVGKPPPSDSALQPSGKPWSVSKLVGRIKSSLADAFPAPVCVVGEISNLKMHTSGHIYFRLKDADAAIDAVMFKFAASRLKFRPTDGLEVFVEARVDIYDVRGQLQLYVESITPKGAGALDLAFRQLRGKLEGQGFFDPTAKRPIPRFPQVIAVVTSATGAAVRDIRRTLRRRWPVARVYLVSVLVQGEGAAEQIARAVALLDANAERLMIDTIIVARGGGGLEDLWAFNEEVVARAIFAAGVPVISGVGHEVDVTIADLVADARAATPTAAAELATPDRAEVGRLLGQMAGRIRRNCIQTLASARTQLDAIGRSVVFRDPAARLRTQNQRLDELSHRLLAGIRDSIARRRRLLEPTVTRMAELHPAYLRERANNRVDRSVSRLRWALNAQAKNAGGRLGELRIRLVVAHPKHHHSLAKHQVDAAARQLDAMSYRSVLGRGFSVTRDADGNILRSAAGISPGASIKTELADGRISSRVLSGKHPPPRRQNNKTSTRSEPTLFDDEG